MPWPEQPVDLTQLSYEWEGRRRTVEDFMIDRESDGLVFIKDGTLVFEAYANGFEAHTLHHCWSSTKAYVSTLIGNAIHLGLIDDVADPIERYLPAVRGSAWEGTSLHHLLRMESGVAWDEHTSHLFRNSQFAQWQRLTLDYLTDGRLGRTRDAFLLGLPRVEAPGARFNYNSANTQVLAWALEQVHPFFVPAIDAVVLSPRFALEVPAAFRPALNSEHSDYRWVDERDARDAASGCFMWPGQRQAIAEILESLARDDAPGRKSLSVLLTPPSRA